MISAIVNGEVIKTAVKSIVTLVSETRFHFKEKGLHSRAVDPANVAMVIIDIPRDSFDVYTLDEEKTIGVDVNRVNDILRTVKKNELVELKVEDGGMLKVKFGNVEYSVSLIDPSAIRKEPKIPELELPAKVVLDAGEFKKAIQAADKIADHVVFRSDENGFYVEARGDIDRIVFHMGEMELIEFNREKARSMFSIEYLKEFIKIAGGGDILTIHLGEDYPVRLTFDVADGKLKVEYILAPRIEAE
ncbi:MAG: DNA polymerase sliding clamp [Archaeoglobales archaeon]|nr:MAG: DNA polymerase sliding clamp [Archaeoglobales archaeon]